LTQAAYLGGKLRLHNLYFDRGKDGRTQEAIADYTQALKLNPKYVDAYIERGYARVRTENFEGALSDFTQALQLAPTNPRSYYHLTCFYSLRSRTHSEYTEEEAWKADITKALDYLEQAVEKGWTDWKHLKQDRDLAPIRNEPRYKQLVPDE